MRSFRLIWTGPASLRLATFTVKTSLALMLLVLVSPATPGAFAQGREKTFADSFTPLVYNVLPFPPPTPPDYGSLPASVFQGLPIATVGYVSTQVAGCAFTSPSDHTKDPFYVLYPELCEGICSGTSNSGEHAAWSWGVSRLIDGMEIATHQSVNPLPIDMKHLAVTGCSFAGKMALYAGAFDERIALTIAQESGGGGATSWRVSHDIEGYVFRPSPICLQNYWVSKESNETTLEIGVRLSHPARSRSGSLAN